MAAVPPLPKSFEDAARHHEAVAEELERVCGSAHFRTSKRSCEFLRYVVQVALDGRMDSLKERSIGIDLFGRDISYDPSSDATVRVRANEVRKRLSSYYAESQIVSALRIDLPTGTYVPHFRHVTTSAKPSVVTSAAHPAVSAPVASWIGEMVADGEGHPRVRPVFHPVAAPVVPPIRSLTLVRPALLALLVCTLLLRHQLENREAYLRFWDRLLSGRSAMVLSVSPQDRASLASSLYPLVWVAGRYGVDATMQGDSLAGARPEATSSVQVSYAMPAGSASDRRLRWVIAGPSDAAAASAQPTPSLLLDRRSAVSSPSTPLSAALLTVLPEDASTLHLQGTDAEAIRHMLEGLTVERNFPIGLAEHLERLDSRHALQVLVFRDASGQWSRDVFWGDV